MKLVCYGTSVTAQKDETGYFQKLQEMPCTTHFDTIERVAFEVKLILLYSSF